MVYFGVQSTSTVSGSTLRNVICEHCGTGYSYVLKCEATGVANSPYLLGITSASKRAEENAMKSLEAQLNTEIEPIPCPSCACYQADMVKKLKSDHCMVLFGACVFFSFAAIAGLLTSWFAWHASFGPNEDVMKLGFIIAAISPAFAVACGLVRRTKVNAFQPNQEDLEKRKQIARERAMLTSELEQLAEKLEDESN